MIAKHELSLLIQETVHEFNAQTGMDQHLDTRPDEMLFGEDGVLDSLGLVNLITLIEEHIEDKYDICLSLADEKAMSRKTSPFRTIGSLMAYLDELLGDRSDG